ncbi:Exocyst complex protein EXO70 [Verticillium dahliae VDG1]|nr:Exocyst complex protein EXO70 [Verticillium dahliae VDG1]
MQANFFNATGRMLPLHLIKAKLEGQGAADEEQMLPRVARFEQMVASWNSSVADSEELLDPALAGEVPEDAMT